MTTPADGQEPPPDPITDQPGAESEADTARVPTPDVEQPPAQPRGLISAQPVGLGSPPDRAEESPRPANQWAPPPTAAAAVSTMDGVVISGVFTRLVAYTIDASLLAAINIAVEVAAGVFSNDPDPTLAIIVAAVLIAVDLLYFVLLWTSGLHATLGMRLMRLQIFGASDGKTLSKNDALLRWLALTGAIAILALVPSVAGTIGLLSGLWLLVLLVTTATNPLRQGLHDRWARSVIVQPAPGGSGLAVVGCLILIVVFVVVLPMGLLLVAGDQIRDILIQAGQSV